MCTALPSIGFVGLDGLGMPMVQQLLNAGFPVVVYDPAPSRVDAAKAAGAYAAETPQAFANRIDLLITMLSGPDSHETLLQVADGALSVSKKSIVWIQMSTLDGAAIQRMARLAEERGAAFIDAPVVGTLREAEEGRLLILVCGDAKAAAYVRPVLARLGSERMVEGPIGAATALAAETKTIGGS
jgi:3-hydroxyisobutyrate dehydrogenase